MMQDEMVSELAKPIPAGKRNQTLFAIGSQMEQAQVPRAGTRRSWTGPSRSGSTPARPRRSWPTSAGTRASSREYLKTSRVITPSGETRYADDEVDQEYVERDTSLETRKWLREPRRHREMRRHRRADLPR